MPAQFTFVARERFEKRGEKRFFANIDAMLCRIALYKNDENTVSEWYRGKSAERSLALKGHEALSIFDPGDGRDCFRRLSGGFIYFGTT